MCLFCLGYTYGEDTAEDMATATAMAMAVAMAAVCHYCVLRRRCGGGGGGSNVERLQ